MNRILPILLTIIFCAMMVVAQTNRGSISGTITDATGAVIPGAVVTITNVGTNQAQKLTTSGDGAFTASSLEPVVYRITVEAPGFKKSLIDNIKVDTSSTASVNVALQAGAIDTVVDVTAASPVLNTESGVVSQTVTERQIQDVPLSNRSVLDLAVTLPNVSGDAGSENPEVTSGQPVPGFNLSLNGGRPGSTSILADGVNNTGVGIARSVVSFTPETVQEFTVSTSAFDAQYGRTGSGVINITTKGGGDQFKGTALWYHRNPVTNARKWTTSTVRPPNNLKYNQGSLTLLGPVYLPRFGEGGKALYNGHSKTFFFAAYEPRGSTDFVVTDTLMPTDAMRTGDFSGLTRIANGWVPTDVLAKYPQIPVTSTETRIFQQFNLVGNKLVPITLAANATYLPFAGNKIPTNMLDPVALKAFEFLPHASNYFLNDAGQLSNFVVNRFVKQDETRWTFRVDHRLTEKDNLNVRYTKVPTVGIRGFGSDINGNGGIYSDAKQVVISDTHTFTPAVLNELRVNYTRGVFSEDFRPEYSIKTGKNLSTELGIPSLTVGGMPLFNFNADGPNAFSSIGAGGSTNNFNVEERYNVNDILYWNRGAMSWKFGVDLNHEILNTVPFFGASGGRWDFRVLNTSNNRSTAVAAGGNVFASYLLGVPNSILARPVLIPYYYRWESGAGFVQNDWKVKPNLTLNMGLRYSLQLPRTEKYNHQGVLRPDLAKSVTLDATQRRAIAVGLGLLATTAPATAAIPSQVPTTALIPAFAYSGRGGRSEYIFPVEKFDFEPRFGFAWSPRKLFGMDLKRSLVVRGGYGISHSSINGNNRAASPDFGATNTISTTATGSTGTVDATQPVRLSANPPTYPNVTFEQALSIPDDGLVYDSSLAIPGFAISGNNKIPYVQNWNLTISSEVMKNTVMEIAYVGSKGTRLYMPRVNTNPRSLSFVELLESANLSADTTFTDPLGRKALNGATLAISRGSVGSQYLGFNSLFSFFDASANSIRHGMYVSVNRRVGKGLSFTANYNFGKSIDTASDASPDTRVLSTASTVGHVTFGAPRSVDRAISTFDIKHNFAATSVFDLPFGKTRRFGKTAWAPIRWIVGDWTTSGVLRLQGGTPFVPTITDANRVSADITHVIRPDLVAGVPLKNPLWKRDCPVGTLCEPWVNPAAFMRPAKGALGSAPRTLDIRGPMQRYFDLSFQKNFPIGEGKRRFQFRVDMLNVTNSPIFRLNNLDMGGLPDEVPITTADYDAWIASDATRSALARTTTAGAATFTQVQNLIANNRLPVVAPSTTGALPLNYYANVQLPQGFATTDANKFDITTLQGFKLYRLRRAYTPSFGTLREIGFPRYLQFGLKLYF